MGLCSSGDFVESLLAAESRRTPEHPFTCGRLNGWAGSTLRKGPSNPFIHTTIRLPSYKPTYLCVLPIPPIPAGRDVGYLVIRRQE